MASARGRFARLVQCATLRKMKASLPEPEAISRKGKPVGVILTIKAYRGMIKRLEDAEDAAYLRKARRKPMKYRPLDDVLTDLATPP